MSIRNRKFLSFALLAALSSAAAFAETKIRVTETAGVAREFEPVRVAIDGREETVFVTIGANQSRVFKASQLRPAKQKVKDSLRIIPGAGPIGFDIENRVYRADLSQWKMEHGIDDSGTLRGITFKEKNVRYERNPNRMHWAPSFQRTGERGYQTIGKWSSIDKHSRQVGDGEVIFDREGLHQNYPEISIQARYRFFAYVPYFIFNATMSITKPIDMYFLRNQEMTMDDLYTHLAWPGADGKPVIKTFEERKPILQKTPLAVDIPWVAFFNQNKGYGYGFVSLKHSATKTANPLLSINDGANNGRYWDRRIINQTSTQLGPGDRFEEETAYVVFKTLDEFLLWEKRIRNPLKVEPVK